MCTTWSTIEQRDLATLNDRFQALRHRLLASRRYRASNTLFFLDPSYLLTQDQRLEHLYNVCRRFRCRITARLPYYPYRCIAVT